MNLNKDGTYSCDKCGKVLEEMYVTVGTTILCEDCYYRLFNGCVRCDE